MAFAEDMRLPVIMGTSATETTGMQVYGDFVAADGKV
jgi:hypothetical protein